MKKENSLMSKLNTIADWIIRLIVINVLLILTALPIITLYPALFASYKLFNDYLKKDEVPIIKTYFKYFKEDFKIKLGLGLLLALVGLLGALNVYYYYRILDVSPSLFFSIGYYVMIVMLVLLLMVTFYTFPVMLVYPKTKLWLLLKFCFFLSGKFVFRTILIFLTLLVPVLMFLTPLTILVFVFMGLSIPVCLQAIIQLKAVAFVLSLSEEEENV